MDRILLIRHGETDWNKDRRIMGRDPVGLNEAGRRQSRSLQATLKNTKVDQVFTSPLLRALQTAEILCAGRGLKPTPDELLLEVDYGEWVGKKFAEVREMPDYIPYYQRLETPVAPEGETLYQVRDRGLAFLEKISNGGGGKNVLVVSHADWIKCILMHFMEIPFENIWRLRIDNASISQIESEKRGYRVISLNHGYSMDHLLIDRISF